MGDNLDMEADYDRNGARQAFDAEFVGEAENYSPTYDLSIGPCEDSGTRGYLNLIDGKWWFCTEHGEPVREVPDDEVIGLKW